MAEPKFQKNCGNRGVDIGICITCGECCAPLPEESSQRSEEKFFGKRA